MSEFEEWLNKKIEEIKQMKESKTSDEAYILPCSESVYIEILSNLREANAAGVAYKRVEVDPVVENKRADCAYWYLADKCSDESSIKACLDEADSVYSLLGTLIEDWACCMNHPDYKNCAKCEKVYKELDQMSRLVEKMEKVSNNPEISSKTKVSECSTILGEIKKLYKGE